MTLVYFLLGCSDKKDSASTSGTFSSVYTNVVNAGNCSVCHQSGGAYAALDLSSSSIAFTNLSSGTVGGPTSGGGCAGNSYVVSGNASNSFLLALFFSDYRSAYMTAFPGCTPYSHSATAPLSTDDKTELVKWIEAGAQNN